MFVLASSFETCVIFTICRSINDASFGSFRTDTGVAEAFGEEMFAWYETKDSPPPPGAPPPREQSTLV